MGKAWLFLIASFAIGAVQTAYASDQDEFCAGFAAGYKSVKGDKATVPECPAAPPVTPIDSTDFREGMRAGIRAAQGK